MAKFTDETSWEEELSPELALAGAKELISERTGVIRDLSRANRLADLPPLYQYTASTTRTEVISDAGAVDEAGSGTSFLPARAELKAVGEALERYAQSIYRESRLTSGPWGELATTGRFLDPRTVAGMIRPGDPELTSGTMRWCEGFSLSDHESCFLPAHLVFVPYRAAKDEVALREPITSGTAAGTSPAGALLRGILELIEREAILLTYLHQHRAPQFDLVGLKDRIVHSALERLDFCRLELRVLDISTDLGVPVAMGVIVDRTGRYPALTLGAKASLSRQDAVRGAIEEAFHSLPWSRRLLERMRSRSERPSPRAIDVSSLEDRLALWAPTERLHDVPFLLEPSGLSDCRDPRADGSSLRERLRALIAGLASQGVELFAVDLTTTDVRAHGFHVVRVVSPQLVPMYLDEHDRAWSGDRLFAVPERLHWPEAKKGISELFSLPHPFL